MRIVANPNYIMKNRIEHNLAKRISKSQDICDSLKNDMYVCLTSTDEHEVMGSFDKLDLLSQYIVSLIIDNTEHEIEFHLDFIMSEIKSLKQAI